MVKVVNGHLQDISPICAFFKHKPKVSVYKIPCVCRFVNGNSYWELQLDSLAGSLINVMHCGCWQQRKTATVNGNDNYAICCESVCVTLQTVCEREKERERERECVCVCISVCSRALVCVCVCVCARARARVCV